MSQRPSASKTVNAAIAALRERDRRTAAQLLRSLVAGEAALNEGWKSVARLAGQIGEIDTAIEAMRRYSLSEPRALEKLLAYFSELATAGRSEAVEALISTLPPAIASRTEITHLMGTLATQRGDFLLAEQYVRRTIEEAPFTGQNWLGLSMIRKFSADDDDLRAMRRIEGKMHTQPPMSRAAFYYALGKALHDAKDFDAAFDAYEKGAALRREEERFDADGLEAFADGVIRDFNAESLMRLKPSSYQGSRAIFVTGLPRSGTTLVEQIITAHSAVCDGGELNLMRAALHPAGDFSYAAAAQFDARPAASHGASDPWRGIAEDYHAMLCARFPSDGLIVDKTLNHSRFMGLILHALPDARVVWLRRDPEDNAISVFRNFFASAIPWSWSLTDIARYFRIDDRLHAHWTKVFPDRILTVPYESLVQEPRQWIGRVFDHVGLLTEPTVFEPHKQSERSVLTASVAQVREPISPAQIGAAKKYERSMQMFRDTYALG
jgi:tetratricopeptide (TPR) repeat protein